jgi:hypothetical protein
MPASVTTGNLSVEFDSYHHYHDQKFRAAVAEFKNSRADRLEFSGPAGNRE